MTVRVSPVPVLVIVTFAPAIDCAGRVDDRPEDGACDGLGGRESGRHQRQAQQDDAYGPGAQGSRTTFHIRLP